MGIILVRKASLTIYASWSLSADVRFPDPQRTFRSGHRIQPCSRSSYGKGQLTRRIDAESLTNLLESFLPASQSLLNGARFVDPRRTLRLGSQSQSCSPSNYGKNQPTQQIAVEKPTCLLECVSTDIENRWIVSNHTKNSQLRLRIKLTNQTTALKLSLFFLDFVNRCKVCSSTMNSL